MAEVIHVLLVEDDEDDYIITRDLLAESRGSFKLEWVPTFDGALQVMSRCRHDVCLVDYRLGRHDGLELLRQAITQGFQAPIIILTGQGDEAIDIAAMKAGAADYLIKGEITALLLERSIRYAIEGKRAQEEIHHLFAETRRLLRQTQKQAQQVQQIMDTVPDGVLLLDSERRIVLANSAARHYLPLLTEAEVGDTLHHLSSQTVASIIEATAAETAWYDLELEGDAQQIFEVTARPVAMDTEPGRGVVLVLRDVREERQRQAYLQTQERLATVGQLAAGIAHDFNNIMAIILLYSQVLEKKPDLPKKSHYLATIAHQAQHAANLIAQILDFSRRSVMSRSRIDLLPLVKEVVKLLGRTLPENITTELVMAEGEYITDADPTRMQQVLMNLAVNARDAMPQGGKLKIWIRRQMLAAGEPPSLPGMSPGEWISISVSDSGMGILPGVLPHIFEPFFSTKPAGRGTGLGLAQVYGIIKQHDGEIDVKSQVGQGTTFTIFLPSLRPSSLSNARAASAPLPRTVAESKTVLLVEDNATVREAIHDALEMFGYRVLVARTGQEALALFGQSGEAIDLVLSDMVMPEMGGVELYRTLKAQWPKVKLVILTGYPLEDEGKALLEQGIVAWIQKPFLPDAIAREVSAVLDGD